MAIADSVLKRLKPWIAPDFYPTLAAFLIIWAGDVVYLNSLQAPLVFDGTVVIDRLTPPRQWTWREVLDVGESRPLVWATFVVNYLDAGLQPLPYHFVNVAIHTAAALTLMGLARRTLELPSLAARFGGLSRTLAFAIALLWVVHPLQTQSVTYVYQRYESLCGLGYLLTLYAFARAQSSPRPAVWLVLSVLALALGMACKEVAATAPLVVLWMDRAMVARSWRELVRRRWWYYGLLALTWGEMFWLMWRHPGYEHAGIGWAPDVTRFEYFITQSAVILHYLRLSLWPVGLCLDYAWPAAHSIREVALPLLLVGGLFIGTLVCIKKRPALGWLGGAFFLILAPTSSFVPIADLAVEHRMYLPLACVLTLVVLDAYALCKRYQEKRWLRQFKKFEPPQLGTAVEQTETRARQQLLAVMAVCAVVLGVLTFLRNRDYDTEITMWKDVVTKAPHNARGHYNLGRLYNIAGNRYEAQWHYERSLELRPNFADIHNDYGELLVGQQDYEGAQREFAASIAVDPKYPQAHNNLGNLLLAKGEFDAAEKHLRTAIELKPDYADPVMNLGVLMLRRGRMVEAKRQYRKALAIRPDFSMAHYNLAAVLAAEGKFDEATEHLQAALRADPRLQLAEEMLETIKREQSP